MSGHPEAAVKWNLLESHAANETGRFRWWINNKLVMDVR
jgi:hypothetical protein